MPAQVRPPRSRPARASGWALRCPLLCALDIVAQAAGGQFRKKPPSETDLVLVDRAEMVCYAVDAEYVPRVCFSHRRPFIVGCEAPQCDNRVPCSNADRIGSNKPVFLQRGSHRIGDLVVTIFFRWLHIEPVYHVASAWHPPN